MTGTGMTGTGAATSTARQSDTIRIDALHRYPVKGLSPERLERVLLRAGEAFPGDRLYALAKPDGPYDAAHFTPLPKRDYFVLMNTAALAGLTTRFDLETTTRVTVSVHGDPVLEADLTSEAGRASFVELYARVLDLPAGEAPVFAQQAGYVFTDNAPRGLPLMNSLSIINLASVADFEKRVGHPVDPLRFRGNLHLSGVEAWAERDWVGRTLRVGDVELRVLKESGRCAATEVDPTTAERDLPVPKLLKREYGHGIVGLYAEVIGGGELAEGAAVELLPQLVTA